MSLNSKVVLSFFLGACSGLLAWILIDFNGFYRLQPQGGASTLQEVFREEAFVGVIFGTLVGLAMGFVNGVGTGSASRFRRELLWGAVVGLMGGLLGLLIGEWFYGGLHHEIDNYSKYPVIGPVAFIGMVLVRGIGWGFIGLFIGLVQGIPSKSKKAAKHGAIGGLIGGFLGGTIFEIVPNLPLFMSNPGIIGRGIGLTVTGASIGLFIGLMQNILKQAWIRVVAGRNEGKEYIISKTRTTIGRDELADIPLFGDMNISQLHAVIDSDIPGKYLLRDAGSTSGMAVNNQRVPEQALRDGDIIQIGKMSLEFHEKAGMKIVKPVDTAAKSTPRLPMGDDVCQFCGGKKDPKTGACACSIGAQAPSGTASLYAPPSDNQAYPASSGARLMGTAGPYAGQMINLPQTGDIPVGRDPSKIVDLSMDNTVSRNHAHITATSDVYTVYDDGSSNGTFVNGVKVTYRALEPGDTVQFGGSSFRFDK